MARKKQGGLKPGQLGMPGVGRDPGVRAQGNFVRSAKRDDPRGQAMGDLANAQRGVADETRSLAESHRRAASTIAGGMEAYANAQSKTGEAISNSANIVANAQEGFGRSIAQLSGIFEGLATRRRDAEDETAISRVALNTAKHDAQWGSDRQANPNPKNLDGKAYIDDEDTSYSKSFDENVIKKTEEELGYKLSSTAMDKVKALSLRARVQNIEGAVREENDRRVVKMVMQADSDLHESNLQVGVDGDIGAGVARNLATVERIKGMITPQQYLAKRQDAIESAYDQGFNYMLEHDDTEGAKALAAAKTGWAGQGSGVNTGILIDVSGKNGVPPLVALAISGRETFKNGVMTFDTNSTTWRKANGKLASSAKGLGHVIDSTWTGAIKEGLVSESELTGDAAHDQALVFSRLTKDHMDKLEREFGGPPTPGEIYLAHVLGYPRAVQVIRAAMRNPEGPNPLPRDAKYGAWGDHPPSTAGGAMQWATSEMDKFMKKVVGAGILVDPGDSAGDAHLPLNKGAEWARKIEAYEQEKQKLADKQRKEFVDAFLPAKDSGEANPRKDRDPAGYMQTYSPKAAEALVQADKLQTPEGWNNYFDTTINEQKLVAAQRGISLSDKDTKLLPKASANGIVTTLHGMKGDQAIKQFDYFRAQWGKNWDRGYNELVDAGLNEDFQLVALQDPDDTPELASLKDVIGTPLADLKDKVPEADVSSITKEVEEGYREFARTFEAGPYGQSTVSMTTKMIETATKVALFHYRTKGKEGAVTAATNLIKDFTIVDTGKVHALVDDRHRLTEAQIEAATAYKQTKEAIAAWRPKAVMAGDEGAGTNADVKKRAVNFSNETTVNTAVNEGVWFLNEDADGLVLAIPVATGSANYNYLVDDENRPLEIKFSDIPNLAAKGSASAVREAHAQSDPLLGGLVVP
jgi:hypothetical protein